MVHDHCGFPTHERASQLHGPGAETELDSAPIIYKNCSKKPSLLSKHQSPTPLTIVLSLLVILSLGALSLAHRFCLATLSLPWRLLLHHRSHRLWRVQDLTMLVRDPLLPFAVLSSTMTSSARGGVATNETWCRDSASSH